MTMTIAFDIYGTLIDTGSITSELNKFMNKKSANNFSALWRTKQIEYTFRRGLMARYCDFTSCTKDALNYTCSAQNINLSSIDKKKLLDAYSTLSAFPDVVDCLESISSENINLYAFSNGKASAIETILKHTNLHHFFIDIVSVDEIRSFKPNPDVYKHFIMRSNSTKDSAHLVSANPFDVMGAVSYGMSGIWLQRNDNEIFDPWEDVSETKNITHLSQLAEVL